MNRNMNTALFVVLVFAASACGGGSSSNESSADRGTCPAAIFEGTMSRVDDVNGGHTAAEYTGEDIKFGSAIEGDGEIRILMSSAEIVEGLNPTADPGEVLVGFGYKPDAPDEEGIGLEQFGRMPSIDNGGSTSHSIGSPVDETSFFVPIENTATWVCMEVNFDTDFMQINGTVSMPKTAKE